MKRLIALIAAAVVVSVAGIAGAGQPPAETATAAAAAKNATLGEAAAKRWRRLKTVRKLDGGFRITRAERRRGRRIIARDEMLAPLLRDAGGHRVHSIGPITPGGRPYRLIGVTTEVSLANPITGTYRLPVACVDLRGEFIPLPPLRVRLEGVDELMVDVSFSERRVFEVQPDIDSSGAYRFVGTPKPMPWSCRVAAKRDRGR